MAPWSGAHAALFPYQNAGTYNAVSYTFKAQNTGDLVAYFTGASAAYDNQIGVLVNGVASPVFGLDDHASRIGQSLDFGQVKAGDTLVFVLRVLTVGASLYSDPSRNGGYDGVAGANHIFATAYDGTDPRLTGVPAGTSVSFDDQAYAHADHDYNDETFVFTNVSSTTKPAPSVPGGPPPTVSQAIPPAAPDPGQTRPSGPPPPGSPTPGAPPPLSPGVPEPGAWALMVLGVGGVGAAIRRSARPVGRVARSLA